MLKNLILISVLVFALSCSERNKVNPFDSSGDIYLSLDITSVDKHVEITWSNPRLDGFTGFNIYRKAEGYDNSFKRIASNLPPNTRQYEDNDILYDRTYLYYLTISGFDIESRPSETIKINPGPGFVWIVDKWGYQVVKTTYDLSHTISSYDTEWPATNMALSKDLGVGVILYLSTNTVDKINLDGERTGRYTQIEYPMDIVYDHNESLFWIVDSSGILYSLDTKTDQIVNISESLTNPTTLFLEAEKGLIYVIDRGEKEIVQFNRQGNRIGTISTINEEKVNDPVRFVIDEISGRTWLKDRQGVLDYIYTKGADENDYTLLDSIFHKKDLIGDLEVNMFDESGWMVSHNGQNSFVVQLSASGSRQLEIFGYYDPYDIKINPYDGTLLVADSGHSLVIHYNRDNNIIGQSRNLTFPVKVLIE